MSLPYHGAKPPAPSGDPAEAWVRFAKLLCLFPRESARVQEAARALRDALDAVRRAEGQPTVALIADGDGVELNGGKPAEVFGPTHEWLAARFRSSALSAVEFGPEATLDGLARFTLRMLQNFARKQADARFEELWPERFPGIRPVELSFDGVFSDEDTGGGAEGPRAAIPLAAEDPFVARLLADERVAGALKAVAGRSDPGEGVELSELVARIREKLPADVAEDSERAFELTASVLRNLLGAGGAGGPSSLSNLRDLLVAASGRVFAREDDGLARAPRPRFVPAVATSLGGHAGDDAIADDLPMFLAEYRRLPAGEVRLSLAEADLVVEQLAVYLHYLLRLEDPARASAALEVIYKLVESSRSDDLEVLASYLSAKSGDGTVERLGLVLQESRVLRVLEDLGVFGLGWAIATFPETFPFYLDSLDLSRREHLMELCIACESIGADRILDAGRELAQKSRLLRPTVVERICAVPFQPLLPLVATILRYGPDEVRPRVAHYLRGLYQHGLEACLLWLYEAPEDVPKDYMLELMSAVDGGLSPSMRRIIARGLCRIAFLKGTDAPTVERRVRAVELMREVPTMETSEALAQLAAGTGLPRMSRGAARIRGAAREALQALKDRAHV